LNVPEYNDDFRQLLRKGKWLVIGLLAPEMVLFTACYQYVRARETARMVSKHLRKRRGGNEAASVSRENIAVSVNEEDEVQVKLDAGREKESMPWIGWQSLQLQRNMIRRY